MAIGAVVGAAVLLAVEGRSSGVRAVLAAAALMAAIGGYCAWLCWRIDARFDLFGGPENGALFLLGGIVPAALGGILYGWALYRRPGRLLVA